MLSDTESSSKQVLLRLPHPLATRLARQVPPRQRNRYIVELLERDLNERDEAESRALIEAAERLNEIEAANPELVRESEEWLDAKLTEYPDDEDFDREKFEREFAQAQAEHGLAPRR